MSKLKPREVALFAAGVLILYREVFVEHPAQPILVFTALFLLGLIPAFWLDRNGKP